MLEISYGGNDELVLEPDVGQVGDLLPEDAVVVDECYSLYGRRSDDMLADHITDVVDAEAALEIARNLGASAIGVPPGPACACHGRLVVFLNDEIPDPDGNAMAKAIWCHMMETIESQVAGESAGAGEDDISSKAKVAEVVGKISGWSEVYLGMLRQ